MWFYVDLMFQLQLDVSVVCCWCLLSSLCCLSVAEVQIRYMLMQKTFVDILIYYDITSGAVQQFGYESQFVVRYFVSDTCKCTGPRKHGIRIPPERPQLTCAQDSTPETKIKREQIGKYMKGIKMSTNVTYQT